MKNYTCVRCGEYNCDCVGEYNRVLSFCDCGKCTICNDEDYIVNYEDDYNDFDVEDATRAYEYYMYDEYADYPETDDADYDIDVDEDHCYFE